MFFWELKMVLLWDFCSKEKKTFGTFIIKSVNVVHKTYALYSDYFDNKVACSLNAKINSE